MPSAPYTLVLLGEVDIRGPDGEVGDLCVQSKVVALLARLSFPTVGRFVRRDTLVGLLWPELEDARARGALRKAVHAIRAEMGANALPGRGDEELALAPDHVTCDADAFRQAADAGLLSRALQLYRGELMPGFHLAACAEFDRWLEDERHALAERAAGAAWALAQRYESENQLSDAAGMARTAMRFSWSDERALRRALMMLDRLGDRAGAARLFDEFARRLRTDLDVEPSSDTVELMARIRAGGATEGTRSPGTTGRT
jgi:DNA-binding SARP family transcriptional activator